MSHRRDKVTDDQGISRLDDILSLDILHIHAFRLCWRRGPNPGRAAHRAKTWAGHRLRLVCVQRGVSRRQTRERWSPSYLHDVFGRITILPNEKIHNCITEGKARQGKQGKARQGKAIFFARMSTRPDRVVPEPPGEPELAPRAACARLDDVHLARPAPPTAREPRWPRCRARRHGCWPDFLHQRAEPLGRARGGVRRG